MSRHSFNVSSPAETDPGVASGMYQGRSLVAHWVFLGVALLVLGGQIAHDQFETRRRIEATAKEQLANYSLVLAEEMTRRLNSMYAVLADMKVTGANQTTVIVPLKRVAALVPVSPSASPSATPTPTVSPSSSPSASPTADAGQLVIDAIDKLDVGVITWATNNNNLYPTPADVTEAGGVAASVDPWPTNPYTGQPMKPGTEPGDYIYEQLNGGAGYKLTGYISNGLTYTVP